VTSEKSPAGIERFDIQSYDNSGFSGISAEIIKEISLEIFLNDQKVVTIACTGNHLKELAVGFLRIEGIIRVAGDLKKIEIANERCMVHVYTEEVYPSRFDSGTIFSSGARLRRPEETLTYNNVGMDSSGRLSYPVITPQKVLSLMEELLSSSYLHNVTHGTHCSALADIDGILVLREDIGRHNTIDMLCGHALLEEVDCSDKILMTTGRISSEIVTKAGKLGVPMIISHSAPTSRAIRLVRKTGITLIGYVRGGKMNVYSYKERVGD